MLRGPASVQTMVNNTSPPGGVFYRMSNNELLMGALPVSLVSNGLAYWNQGMYRTQWSRAPFVVHSNYMVGRALSILAEYPDSGVESLKVFRFCLSPDPALNCPRLESSKIGLSDSLSREGRLLSKLL